MKRLKLLLIAAPMLLTSGFAHADKLAFGPFGGSSLTAGQGYQELKLSSDRWYVAYQGNRSTSSEQVDAAWAARAAQLCGAIGTAYFVELRYQTESVVRDDVTTGSAQPDSLAAWSMRQTAGAVYVPIFIPGQPQVITPQTAPSKLAAVLCVRDAKVLKDAARAVDHAGALAKAKQLDIELGR